MRCLTLADVLKKRGARIAFACALIPDSLAARIEQSGHILHRIGPVEELVDPPIEWDKSVVSPQAQREDARRTFAAADTVDWVLMDHYRLDRSWLEAAAPDKLRLVIDDLANRHHDCDILVDQTFGRREDDYGQLVPDDCRILTGGSYAMLRPEFRGERAGALSRREQPQPLRRILISLGLTDVDGITAAALAAVRAAGLSIDIDVVVGDGAPSLAVLKEVSRNDPRVHLHVDAPDMAGLIARADLAIGAAGTSSWERCCLGLPTIALILADNQRLVAGKLEETGAIIVADSPAIITPIVRALADGPDRRLSMVAAAAAITDGRGAERVADALTDRLHEFEPALSVRRATGEDSRMAWLWRNDYATRIASRTNAPLPWPDHQSWWSETLASLDRQVFITEADHIPVGIVRFDRQPDGSFEVSINLDPSARGTGLGGRVLAEACGLFISERGNVRLLATIHRSNAASRRIFEKVGFVHNDDLSQPPFERYVRREGAGA